MATHLCFTCLHPHSFFPKTTDSMKVVNLIRTFTKNNVQRFPFTRNYHSINQCATFNSVPVKSAKTDNANDASPKLQSASRKSKSVDSHPHRRSLSWTSWMTSWKSDDKIVRPGKVSPPRHVPEHIPKPLYVLSGIVPPQEGDAEIKTAEQIERMQESCGIARDVLRVTGQAVQVGVTTDELDAIAHEATISRGAYPSPLHYKRFPKSICTSVNNVVCHGIPDDRPLQNGDIINIDVTVYYNGYHGDLSSTFLVGEVDQSKQRLVEVTEFCRDAAIHICQPGVEFNMIGSVISSIAEEEGYNVVAPFCGHGIGQDFHTMPAIYHFENNGTGTMEEGMTFTIEPILVEGDSAFTVLKDNWTAVTRDNSWAAQFEHTVLITKNGVEILTA